MLVFEILELLATLLLLKSTIKPNNRLTNIFKFNELSTKRNWLLASALGFGLLILLVSLTSVIADRLYGVKVGFFFFFTALSSFIIRYVFSPLHQTVDETTGTGTFLLID